MKIAQAEREIRAEGFPLLKIENKNNTILIHVKRSLLCRKKNNKQAG